MNKTIRNIIAATVAGLMIPAASFALTGCGSSSYSDEGVSGEYAEEEEPYEEEYEEEYDPYVDGMTLEEAKEWESCSTFIMKDDVFYPLVPAFEQSGSVGVPSPGEGEDYGPFVCMRPEYSYYELPVLTKDAKLVEVEAENEEAEITSLPGKSGWTVPWEFCISCDDLGSDESSQEIHAFGNSETIEGPEGLVSALYDLDLREINGTPANTQEIENQVTKIRHIESEDPDSWTDDGMQYREAGNTDWGKLFGKVGLKPYYVYCGSGCIAYGIIDAQEGDDIEVAYRTSDGVETETLTAVADSKYFNLPGSVTSPQKVKRYGTEYTETDEGYSVITNALEPGNYAYNPPMYGKDVYLFEVR